MRSGLECGVSVPQIRTHMPSFHRWNGRLFLTTAAGLSLTGLYINLDSRRHAQRIRLRGNQHQCCTYSFLRLYDLACSVNPTFRGASHMGNSNLSSGQRAMVFLSWNIRLILINRGPVGIGRHFDAPFVVFWTVGCYLVPLAMFELIARAGNWDSSGWRSAVMAVLVVLALLTVVGIFGVYLLAWQPVLSGL